MVTLDPQLTGRHIRLEPLASRHLAGLTAASAGGQELYKWTKTPIGADAIAAYIAAACQGGRNGSPVRSSPQRR